MVNQLVTSLGQGNFYGDYRLLRLDKAPFLSYNLGQYGNGLRKVIVGCAFLSERCRLLQGIKERAELDWEPFGGDSDGENR